MLTATAIAVTAWFFLLAARGGFWRAHQRLRVVTSVSETLRETWPEIVAIIPARDEAEIIELVLRSHAATRYPGQFSVILVDDGSQDGTADAARRIAQDAPRAIHVISAPDLPDGWSGKLWALQTGLTRLEDLAPDAQLLLLTDADICHAPETLERLVRQLNQGGLDLVSLMARLDARGIWAALLIPAFVFFFQKLYPFPWVNDAGRRVAAAAGGCILIRRAALARIGGFAAIRGALIDDCALARAVKRGQGGSGRIWLGLADNEVVSMRDNRDMASIWSMVTRTAFTQLGRSPGMLAGALAGIVLVYSAGPLAALSFPWHVDAWAGTFGAVAWMLSGFAYLPTLRLYGKSPWQALALPLAAALYSAMTLGSAFDHWRGQGGHWKGRSY